MKIILGYWKYRSTVISHREIFHWPILGQAFLTTNMAIQIPKKTGSNHSKNVSPLICTLIYFDKLEVGSKGVIYKNKKRIWQTPHTSKVILFIKDTNLGEKSKICLSICHLFVCSDQTLSKIPRPTDPKLPVALYHFYTLRRSSPN